MRGIGSGGAGPEAVGAYLTTRFPQNTLPTALTPLIYQLTEGNPLFMDGLVQDCIARGLLVEVEGHRALAGALETVKETVPKSQQQLIERWISGHSSEEQEVLRSGVWRV